jgi:hypothetical protein
MCNVLLPPGVNPIAVNKYVYHIYYTISYPAMFHIYQIPDARASKFCRKHLIFKAQYSFSHIPNCGVSSHAPSIQHYTTEAIIGPSRILGSLVQNLLYITYLAPKIWKQFLRFGEICVPPVLFVPPRTQIRTKPYEL